VLAEAKDATGAKSLRILKGPFTIYDQNNRELRDGRKSC
jgi:hypothetical protein